MFFLNKICLRDRILKIKNVFGICDHGSHFIYSVCVCVCVCERERERERERKENRREKNVLFWLQEPRMPPWPYGHDDSGSCCLAV
jgi:hypothetical protein